MWLVVGAVRRDGRLIQLPEALTRLAAEIGWIPREQITWAKGKSLPWARFGEFRDVTEQIILLSKSGEFLFNLTHLSSPDPTSVWWRRYPERYSPSGEGLLTFGTSRYLHRDHGSEDEGIFALSQMNLLFE